MTLNRKMKFRDIQVAEDVGKKAELGWFDVEFIMYGCAYWDKEKDKMYYKVSSDASDIYDFIEKSMTMEIFPSNVMSLTKRCPVPAGMKELIAQDVKKDLGRKMKECYPKEFFYELYALAEKAENNTAAEILQKEAEQLEGVFEEKKLKKYEDLVKYARSCKQINKIAYEALKEWIAGQYKDMEDDSITKDKFEKTLYGIAYEEKGKIKYIINAQKSYIYEHLYAMEIEGVFTTPIYSKSYWYNYTYRLKDVNQDFKYHLEEELDTTYIEKIKKIRNGKKQLNSEDCMIEWEELKKKYRQEAYETILRYGYRWGSIRTNNDENIKL